MDPRKGTIIITGSSGMIGSPLSAMLGAAYNAVGFDRAGPPYPPIEVECVSVDLTADDRIRRALARVRFAYGPRLASVIHLAAYYDFSGEPSPLYEEITVRGTERLLRALHEMQFDVEQFIFSSTMLVHAPGRPGERICEDSPVEPRWDYPRSKAETEKVIKAERGAIPSVILRIAGVYDERLPLHPARAPDPADLRAAADGARVSRRCLARAGLRASRRHAGSDPAARWKSATSCRRTRRS